MNVENIVSMLVCPTTESLDQPRIADDIELSVSTELLPTVLYPAEPDTKDSETTKECCELGDDVGGQEQPVPEMDMEQVDEVCADGNDEEEVAIIKEIQVNGNLDVGNITVRGCEDPVDEKSEQVIGTDEVKADGIIEVLTVINESEGPNNTLPIRPEPKILDVSQTVHVDEMDSLVIDDHAKFIAEDREEPTEGESEQVAVVDSDRVKGAEFETVSKIGFNKVFSTYLWILYRR